MKRAVLREQPSALARGERLARAMPMPMREARLVSIKQISRRLVQDLATVYNWKNRKKDPLPVEETMSGLMVDRTELMNWLADNEPQLVLTWNATKEMSEEDLRLAAVSMNKADVLLLGIKKVIREARA